jgi:AraC family transcriptional regulator
MVFFEDCIEEIEKNLTGEIDVERLAKMAKLSVYEFRRIFSFVAGLPLNEYIRKRRLSLAVLTKSLWHR